MLSESLKESIIACNVSDIIRLKLIIDSLYEKEKAARPNFRNIVYQVKHPDLVREKSKMYMRKKREEKKNNQNEYVTKPII